MNMDSDIWENVFKRDKGFCRYCGRGLLSPSTMVLTARGSMTAIQVALLRARHAEHDRPQVFCNSGDVGNGMVGQFQASLRGSSSTARAIAVRRPLRGLPARSGCEARDLPGLRQGGRAHHLAGAGAREVFDQIQQQDQGPRPDEIRQDERRLLRAHRRQFRAENDPRTEKINQGQTTISGLLSEIVVCP